LSYIQCESLTITMAYGDNMFKGMNIDETYSKLHAHIKKESWFHLQDGKMHIHIDGNGDSSWWYTDLIKLICEKIKNSDPDIVKFCLDNGIDLFELASKPKLKK